MIDTPQTVFLALLQGFTEFLPISSSAHLVIPALVLGWQDQGLAFDVAVHVGTLLAVVIYYRSELLAMLLDCVGLARGRGATENTRMVAMLALATLPVVVVGFLADDFIEENLRTLPVIATTTLIFGLLLGWSDRGARRRSGSRPLSMKMAFTIGLAQAIAPIPGVSRSGITITAGLFLGLDRVYAARFAFLLSIPVITGAGILKARELATATTAVDWYSLGTAAIIAAITAYACIGLFLKLLNRIGLMPFVYYRIALAACLYGLWLA